MQRVTDPGTGLQIQVLQGPGPGEVSVEMGNGTVGIQQKYANGRSTTVLTTPAERISMTLGLDGIVVVGSGERVTASARDSRQVARLSQTLDGSDAVHRAIDLLGRVRLGDRSPVGHVLLLTRAVLQSASGDASGGRALARWVQTASAGLRVHQSAFRDGPGDCWDEYVKEAIEAWDEYCDCVANGVLNPDECTVIYDLRAIGDFSWWVTCVGIRG